VKQLVKRAMLAAAPAWTTSLLSGRARAHKHRLVREWKLNRLTEKLLTILGPNVRSGPFEGMKLTPMSHQEILGPFLLGTYEFQLHPWFRKVAGGRFSQIINVGSSFGYYAVGLARLFPDSEVIAFDTDRWARAACREMASENRTSNVDVARFCSPAWLYRNLQRSSLIMCDCEGYEAELFTGSTSSVLRSATVIVETHDQISVGVTDRIRVNFSKSHKVATVFAEPANVPLPPIDHSLLTADEIQDAIREVRGDQAWLLLTPECETHR
jgi:hypothetical protein